MWLLTSLNRCVGGDASHGTRTWRGGSFKYECLPNICYWCGQLCHDDKDCVLWLQSNGILVEEECQFGLRIRAAQYIQSRKIVEEVQGYEASRYKTQASTGVVMSTSGAVTGKAMIESSSLLNQLVSEGA